MALKRKIAEGDTGSDVEAKRVHVDGLDKDTDKNIDKDIDKDIDSIDGTGNLGESSELDAGLSGVSADSHGDGSTSDVSAAGNLAAAAASNPAAAAAGNSAGVSADITGDTASAVTDAGTAADVFDNSEISNEVASTDAAASASNGAAASASNGAAAGSDSASSDVTEYTTAVSNNSGLSDAAASIVSNDAVSNGTGPAIPVSTDPAVSHNTGTNDADSTTAIGSITDSKSSNAPSSVLQFIESAAKLAKEANSSSSHDLLPSPAYEPLSTKKSTNSFSTHESNGNIDSYRPKNQGHDSGNSSNGPRNHSYDNSRSRDSAYDNQSNYGAHGNDNNQGYRQNSNHNDSTYIKVRMYCDVKEASTIVGKKGETINRIRNKAKVQINISENIKDNPERIVVIEGASEDVAKSFGLIARIMLDEPEDEPASTLSKQFTIKILVPHFMMGFLIGKAGVRFKEIEENSAAKLKAGEHTLPYSTDRVLAIAGVADAIHIAIYYITQTILEHTHNVKNKHIVLYDPINYHPNNVDVKAMNIGPPQNRGNNFPPQQPYYHSSHQGSHYNEPKQLYNNYQQPYSNTSHPQQHQHYGAPPPARPINIPTATPYTDEHGNIIVGDVITRPPVPAPGAAPDKFTQDVFIANINIGSVIGKRGNNIKMVREHSGCSYVRIEEDKGQSIMLGNGQGLTNIRKLVLTGNVSSLQNAVQLINQRIAVDKERNAGM